MLFEDGGRVRSLPTAWTSLASPDPFVAVSAGRSFFRIQDLVALLELSARRSPPPGQGKEDSAANVKENMPVTPPSARRALAVEALLSREMGLTTRAAPLFLGLSRGRRS